MSANNPPPAPTEGFLVIGYLKKLVSWMKKNRPIAGPGILAKQTEGGIVFSTATVQPYGNFKITVGKNSEDIDVAYVGHGYVISAEHGFNQTGASGEEDQYTRNPVLFVSSKYFDLGAADPDAVIFGGMITANDGIDTLSADDEFALSSGRNYFYLKGTYNYQVSDDSLKNIPTMTGCSVVGSTDILGITGTEGAGYSCHYLIGFVDYTPASGSDPAEIVIQQYISAPFVMPAYRDIDVGEIPDLALPAGAQGDILYYDGTAGEWVVLTAGGRAHGILNMDPDTVPEWFTPTAHALMVFDANQQPSNLVGTSTGDMLYWNGTNWTEIDGSGAAEGAVLRMGSGSVPYWDSPEACP